MAPRLVDADAAIKDLEKAHNKVTGQDSTERVLIRSHLRFAIDVLRALPEWKGGEGNANDRQANIHKQPTGGARR